MDLALLRSTWSEPRPALSARAFEHHAAAYEGWLSHSGAEGRLALVLSSGPRATERLLSTLSRGRVDVVHAPSTPARPLHLRLATHSGDHFNHTLYVVDGFDAGDPGDQLRTLEGQRSMLKKMATWVAIVAESPQTVAAIANHAPGLWRDIQRRVLVLDSELLVAGAAPLEAHDCAGFGLAESLYHYAMTPQAAPDYRSFSRLVRSGYVPLVTEGEQHPERQRLAALWATREIPFEPADAGPAAAEAIVRHRDVDDATREVLDPVLSPEARLAAGWPLPNDPVFEALRRLETPDADAIAALRESVAADGIGASLRAHAELAIASAHAGAGELDACRAALEAAVDHGGPEELRFDVLEKLAQIHTFSHQRSAGREVIDALEALAPRLQSPYYVARLLRARGEFLEPLDAHRAGADLSLAVKLFDGHGYP